MSKHHAYRLCCLLLGIFCIALVHGQAGRLQSGLPEWYSLERSLFGKKESMHTAVWPLRMADVAVRENGATQHTGRDSTLHQGMAASWKSRLHIRPLLHLAGGYSNLSGGLYTTAAGFDGRWDFHEKWSFQASVLAGAEGLPNYVSQFVDSLGVVPGMGRNLLDQAQSVAWFWPSASLSYAPSKYFQIDLGFGNHRFGSGYRSLMLSDVAYNYPYLRITTDVWKFKYTNLFAALTHVADEAFGAANLAPKYIAAHHLSWAISKTVTFSVFESVVWQGNDSLTSRSFDPNYLNPVIFYRPVEFAMGSPDRMLVGADLSVRIAGKAMVYGQVVFDEFLLEYLRERSGWWANKWAVQLGVTAYDLFGIDGLRVQAEFNLARPFIYSHGSVVQNYAHYHQPLAHPLGSNFGELVGMALYQKGDWLAEVHTVVSRFGRDDGPNMGGDLFRSYANPAFEFGNTIGQGLGHEVFFQRLSFGRTVYAPLDLRLALRYTYRMEKVGGSIRPDEHFVGIHLSTSLPSRYRDF